MNSVSGLRATLEGFAARHAAERVAGGTDPQPLLDCFRRLKQAADAGNYRGFAAADRAFHQAIIKLADVGGLEAAWRAAFAAQNAFRVRTLRQCWPDLVVLLESHRAVVDAIAAGDAYEAEDAAVAHLEDVWFRLSDAINNGSLPRDPLARACAYLAFHFREPVRLPQLARDIAHCSGGHLARLFRDQLGVSFSDYLIEQRLQKAADLLRHSRRPIREVAARVGYADASRFATHFRRRFASTPKAFRHRHGRFRAD